MRPTLYFWAVVISLFYIKELELELELELEIEIEIVKLLGHTFESNTLNLRSS